MQKGAPPTKDPLLDMVIWYNVVTKQPTTLREALGLYPKTAEYLRRFSSAQKAKLAADREANAGTLDPEVFSGWRILGGIRGKDKTADQAMEEFWQAAQRYSPVPEADTGPAPLVVSSAEPQVPREAPVAAATPEPVPTATFTRPNPMGGPPIPYYAENPTPELGPGEKVVTSKILHQKYDSYRFSVIEFDGRRGVIVEKKQESRGTPERVDFRWTQLPHSDIESNRWLDDQARKLFEANKPPAPPSEFPKSRQTDFEKRTPQYAMRWEPNQGQVSIYAPDFSQLLAVVRYPSGKAEIEWADEHDARNPHVHPFVMRAIKDFEQNIQTKEKPSASPERLSSDPDAETKDTQFAEKIKPHVTKWPDDHLAKLRNKYAERMPLTAAVIQAEIDQRAGKEAPVDEQSNQPKQVYPLTPWGLLYKKHLKENRPKMYAALEKSGELDRAAYEAQEEAKEAVHQSMKRKVPFEAARELALADYILLPAEEDQENLGEEKGPGQGGRW